MTTTEALHVESRRGTYRAQRMEVLLAVVTSALRRAGVRVGFHARDDSLVIAGELVRFRIPPGVEDVRTYAHQLAYEAAWLLSVGEPLTIVTEKQMLECRVCQARVVKAFDLADATVYVDADAIEGGDMELVNTELGLPLLRPASTETDASRRYTAHVHQGERVEAGR